MYNYETEKPALMTDEGQRKMFKFRDYVMSLLKTAGAVRMGEIMTKADFGNSWTMMAAVDRLVEIGDLREIEQATTYPVAGQHRVFVNDS